MTYEYSNGVALSDPWRYTPRGSWLRGGFGSNWHQWMPAKIEYAGNVGYYRGER